MVRPLSTVESVCEEVDQLTNKITEPLDGQPVTLILAALLTASASILDNLIEEAQDQDPDTIIGATILIKRNLVLKQTLADIIESRIGK